MKILFVVIIAFGLQLFTATAEAAEGCNPFEMEIITTPAPPANIGSLESLKTVQISNGIDFALLGDSIANQLSAAKLPQSLGSVSPLIMTGGGDGFQHALYKLNYFKKELKEITPKKAVIVLGTNNIGYSACALQAGFKNYFAKVKEIWPSTKFFVLPILPRGNGFPINDIFTDYNGFLKSEADRLGYSLINIDRRKLTCGLEGEKIVSATNTDKAEPAEKLLQCNADLLLDIERKTQNLSKDISNSCYNSVTLYCTNYRPDNIHLSNTGIITLRDSIVSALGKI